MRNQLIGIFISSLMTLPAFAATPATKATVHTASYNSTKETLQNITPNGELKRLMEGNARFVNNKPIQRNLLQQAKMTSLKGQFPAAVILSCMDSRGSPELIFDQGLGDVFSVRVAGNVVDNDQIGGMEFATKAVGSKLIVVMGHTQCGAVRGACQNVQFGNLTELLNKIQPAVTKVKDASNGNIDCSHNKTIDDIAKQNVLDVMRQIEETSSIIHDQVSNKQVLIVGAMHDLHGGKVVFFDEAGNEIKPAVN
jgi:carbonic anhydrase